ncbi:hypothetical protein D4R99_00270 [bacterium]|nr:MAG: hypothetical protein D4R99_00270 [bacterium]
MFYDKTFSDVSVDSGIELRREPRIHFGRMIERDTSEEGSYGIMLHRPYSTSLDSVLIFEHHKNDMLELRKYFDIMVDKNVNMRKKPNGNYALERYDFTVIGAQNISIITSKEYEELLRMAKNCAQDERFLKHSPEPPSVKKLMEGFCELTGTPFEKTRTMCLGAMERKLERMTGKRLELLVF